MNTTTVTKPVATPTPGTTTTTPTASATETPAASVTPLFGQTPDRYGDAIEAYLTAAGIAASSRRVYRIALETWAWLATGQQPPAGRERRGCVAPEVALAALDSRAGAGVLARAFAERADTTDADTVNRELSILRSAIAWMRATGWLATDPSVGLQRRPAPPDRTRALSRPTLAALWEIKAGLREKTLWHMLYDTCARVEELLTLDVEDLDLPNKRGRVIAKGGATEWVHWASPTAQLLPRLIGGRGRGPVFLTDRAAPARNPDPGCLPGHRPGPAVLPPRRGAVRRPHPPAGQPRPASPGRRAGVHPAPAAPLRADA